MTAHPYGAPDLIARFTPVKQNHTAENPVLGPITNHIRYPLGVLWVFSKVKMNEEGRVRLWLSPVTGPRDVSVGWLPRLPMLVLFQVTQLVKPHSQLVYGNRNHFNQPQLKGAGANRLCAVRMKELRGDREACQRCSVSYHDGLQGTGLAYSLIYGQNVDVKGSMELLHSLPSPGAELVMILPKDGVVVVDVVPALIPGNARNRKPVDDLGVCHPSYLGRENVSQCVLKGIAVMLWEAGHGDFNDGTSFSDQLGDLCQFPVRSVRVIHRDERK